MARKLTDSVALAGVLPGLSSVVATEDGGFVALVSVSGGRRLQVFDGDGRPMGEPVDAPLWATGIVAIDGGFLVIGTTDEQFGAPVVTGQRLDEAGAPVGDRLLISDAPDDDLGRAEVVALADGSIVVAWYDENVSGINARRLDAGGEPIGDTFTLIRLGFTETGFRLFAAGDGFAVEYRRGDYEGLQTQTYDAEGEPVGPPVPDADPPPAVAQLDDGGTVVVSVIDGVLIGQEFDADGSARTDRFLIDDGARNHGVASVVVYDDGAYAAIWTETGGGTFVRRFAAFAADAGPGADADDIAGTTGDETLIGLGGDDVIFGFAGADVLDGGQGADMMYGGAGDDAYLVDDAADEVGEFADGGADAVFSTVSFSLADGFVETLILQGDALDGIGNALDNLIRGTDGANTLDGGQGADVLEGGKGDDVYVYELATGRDSIVEKAGEGFDTVYVRGDWTVAANVERAVMLETEFVPGSAPGRLTGNSQNNRLVGNSLANLLDGRGGADQMAGGKGDDLYYVDAGDRIYERAGEGLDSVYAFTSYTLSEGSFERLFAFSETGVGLRITGNSEVNQIIVESEGDDVIDGGGGGDQMRGGGGNDTYYVDHVNDRVLEFDEPGVDLVVATVSFDLGGRYVEKLWLRGSGDIDGTGNSLANRITGNNGDNRLDGKGGSDVLTGGKGDDTYVVDRASDVVVERSGEGTDTVLSSVSFGLAGVYAERLQLTGTADINAIGNSLDNTLTGNLGANVLDGGKGRDGLFGGFGNDTLLGGTGDDALTGGFGADQMDGGAGVDRYIFTSIVETTLAESDTIRTLEAEDRIDLSAIDADGLNDGDDAFALVAAFSNQRGQATLSYDAGSNRTALLLDVDGDGAADARIWITGEVTTMDTSLL